MARSLLLPQVSFVHGVSHIHLMVLPALLPVLPAQMGVSFVQLGFALSLFNIVSAVVQAPLGFAVDRFGARRVLSAGLLLGSASLALVAVFPTYGWLVAAMALAGLANGVYHPADYAMLSEGIDEKRMGRAFSVHTFAGFLGGAATPALAIGIAAAAGFRWSFAAVALLGFAGFAFLQMGRTAPASASARAGAKRPSKAPASGAPAARRVSMLTPAILVLTALFALLNLSVGSIEKFSVTVLGQGYGVPLAVGNTALTAFMFASAFGVLAGGVLADRTQRHGLVAALSFASAAALVALVTMTALPAAVLVLCLGATGFLTGLIAPSRDMLVRAAAPAGQQGKAFGIVSTGFNIGGTVGPLLFGWLLDNGHPLAVFWCTITFMSLVVALTLMQERSTGQRVLSRA